MISIVYNCGQDLYNYDFDVNYDWNYIMTVVWSASNYDCGLDC